MRTGSHPHTVDDDAGRPLATDDALEMMAVGLMDFPLVGQLISTLGEDPSALDELKTDTQGFLDSHDIDLTAAEFHQVLPLIVDNISTQYDHNAGLSTPEEGLSSLDQMVHAVSDYHQAGPDSSGGDLHPGMLTEQHFDPLLGAGEPDAHGDPADGVDHSAFGYDDLDGHVTALHDGGAAHATYGAGSVNGTEHPAAETAAVGGDEPDDEGSTSADVHHVPADAEALQDTEHHLDDSPDVHHDHIDPDHHVDPLLGGEHGGAAF